MNNTSCSLLISALIALGAPVTSHAAECSRADINHYLDKGFSLAQITKLCGEESDTAAPKTAATVKTDTTLSNISVFLQTAIDAEQVDITPDAVILTQDRCFPYGEEGYSGIRPSACVVKKVRIARKGLTIGDVIEERFIIREGKLIVQGDIRQTFERTGKLRKRELKGLQAQYPAHLSEYNLPVKKSMKRKKIAEALEKLAK
jgi:DNA-binding transcriptional MerR regulator